MKPDPEVDQKCCFEGCEVRGFPSEGFDWYVCNGCLDELVDLIMERWERMVARHALN